MANSLILTKAQNAITAHDWTTAARLYKELLRGNESNVEYLQQLGSIYVRAGQDEKAIPYYEQIITLKPNNSEAMVSLGGIFRRLKRYEDSVNILNKAQDISSNASVNYSLGFTYKEMGDYDDAIDAFESVISHNPDDVLAHNHLGSIYFAKKEYNPAIAAYKRGLQVDQNHPILNFNLAHVYEAMKNYPEAVRCYEIALKTRPGWLEAIRDFSELLIKCQDTKQAQELVEQSIKLHPDDVDLLCILGRIYLNQFDYDNATKTFKKAENLKHNDINILIGLSKALEKGMKIEPAMEKILDAVDIAPENLDVCKQYAHVLLSAQRYDKALEMIKKIDEKGDGKDLQTLDLYGQYFVCRGDEEAANTYFDKIKKINHHYKDYMINAADRYIQTGNYEKAEEMANRFVDSRPHLPEGYNLLGTINSARGELSKAKTEYEKGISFKNPNIYAVKELEKIYNEMEANKEIYNDGEMPIEVDADKLSEEQGGNLAEDGSLIDSDDKTSEQIDALMAGADKDEELPDIGSLEATPPIEQALTGEDGEFWEDFDDDPDAEPKPPVDEEDEPYDENEEDSDLMSMMTPAAADDESLENGLSQDEGDFDFGDYEDATSTGPAAPATDNEASSAQEPAFDQEPVESTREPEPAYEPEPAPAPAPRPAASPVEDPVSSAEAQRLMDDLKQQKKELEMQQRELALQQRELADELKQENEKMIQQSVEKAVEDAIEDAVDEAVEEKLSGYDLKPETKPEPEPEPVVEPEPEVVAEPEPVVEPEPEVEIEPEPVVDEEPVVDGEPVVEPVETTIEPELEVEPEPEMESEAEPEPEEEFNPLDDSSGVFDIEATEEYGEENPEEDEILAEEAVLDGLSSDDVMEETPEEAPVIENTVVEQESVIEEEPVFEQEAEVESEPEPELETESETEVEAEPEMVVADDNPVVADDNPVVEPVETTEDLTSEPFVTVDDVLEFSESLPEKEPVPVPEMENTDAVDEESDDSFVTADDMIDKIGRILNDDETAKNYAAELELFKTLRTLSGYLPEKDKNSFDCCRMRMVIEYIIQKLSGKPGLLITAESLIKSGVLGEEYNRQLEDCCEEELSNDLIRHVITDMKKLAQGLENRELCNALCVSADGILEQIALIDQKVAIFG